jgi:hypothetical protein
MAQQMLADAGDRATAAAIEALREALRAYQGSDGVTLRSAAWLVTARR